MEHNHRDNAQSAESLNTYIRHLELLDIEVCLRIFFLRIKIAWLQLCLRISRLVG
ncbi:MAG: hypothetical protein JXB07_04415 [Anaerolineae bacterium]|nr:hypothetical protein [Anaerolineae bacterium]